MYMYACICKHIFLIYTRLFIWLLTIKNERLMCEGQSEKKKQREGEAERERQK